MKPVLLATLDWVVAVVIALICYGLILVLGMSKPDFTAIISFAMAWRALCLLHEQRQDRHP